jgi:peptide/nickel transport system permease protein
VRLPLIEGISLIVLATYVIGSLIVPLVFDLNYARTDLSSSLRPPTLGAGNTKHLFGTDQLGRDVAARLAYGARISLTIAVFSLFFAAIVGSTAGMVAGYNGGPIDAVLSRLMDAQLSMPFIMLALVIVLAVGPSLAGTVLVIAASSWVPFARIVRAEVLVIGKADYVALAQVAGIRGSMILWRHVLPNLASPILVLLSMDFGKVIIYEAALSFLGLGVQPPATSWGLMIAEGRTYLQTAPWLALVPAFALAMVALAANLIADYVRDRLDPRLALAE